MQACNGSGSQHGPNGARDERTAICRHDADQRFPRRPEGPGRRRRSRVTIRTSSGSRNCRRDGETITLGAKGRPLLVIEADKSAKPDDPQQRRPVPHRVPAALARRSRPLDQACHRQQYPDRRGVRPSGQRGALPDRSGRQRHRNLRRPRRNGLEEERFAGRHGDGAAGHSRRRCRPFRRETPAGRALRKTASSAMSISGSAIRGKPRNGGIRSSASTRWPNTAERRVPVVRRLSPPYRREFLAERRRGQARSGREPGLAWVEMRSAQAAPRTAVEDPWGTVITHRSRTSGVTIHAVNPPKKRPAAGNDAGLLPEEIGLVALDALPLVGRSSMSTPLDLSK